jgi:hypothetical protein
MKFAIPQPVFALIAEEAPQRGVILLWLRHLPQEQTSTEFQAGFPALGLCHAMPQCRIAKQGMLAAGIMPVASLPLTATQHHFCAASTCLQMFTCQRLPASLP